MTEDEVRNEVKTVLNLPDLGDTDSIRGQGKTDVDILEVMQSIDDNLEPTGPKFEFGAHLQLDSIKDFIDYPYADGVLSKEDHVAFALSPRFDERTNEVDTFCAYLKKHGLAALHGVWKFRNSVLTLWPDASGNRVFVAWISSAVDVIGDLRGRSTLPAPDISASTNSSDEIKVADGDLIIENGSPLPFEMVVTFTKQGAAGKIIRSLQIRPSSTTGTAHSRVKLSDAGETSVDKFVGELVYPSAENPNEEIEPIKLTKRDLTH